jgi:hypothetical protein
LFDVYYNWVIKQRYEKSGIVKVVATPASYYLTNILWG